MFLSLALTRLVAALEGATRGGGAVDAVARSSLASGHGVVARHVEGA
jgi:hypothetical protein